MSFGESLDDQKINDLPFIVVKSKYRRKRSQKTKQNHLIDCLQSEIDVEVTTKKITEACQQIKESAFYKDTLRIICDTQRSIESIVCFGIGKFGDCPVSRHQLALILTVRKDLNIKRAIFHEPILSTGERQILLDFDCTVFEENVEGKYLINWAGNTLVYLPHCPKQLTNNLLWKNWNSNLSKFIFICNSISGLLNSTPERFLQQDAAYLLKIASHCREIPLKNSFEFPNRFNDTSVHLFHTDNLSDDFWLDSTEPKYSEDTELITAKLSSSLSI